MRVTEAACNATKALHCYRDRCNAPGPKTCPASGSRTDEWAEVRTSTVDSSVPLALYKRAMDVRRKLAARYSQAGEKLRQGGFADGPFVSLRSGFRNLPTGSQKCAGSFGGWIKMAPWPCFGGHG